jgi:glutamate--cysteine ligase
MAKKFRCRAGAPAARDRIVRQLALHRGQAQRLSVLPQPHLVGHRSRSAPACCPSCSTDGFGYERYADYMLDVPMYFVFRDGKYIDAAGMSLPRLPEGRAARCCPAKSRRWTTGTIICRPPSPKCGSRPSSRCAAPMAVRGTGSAPCPPSGSDCSTIDVRARCGLGPGQGLEPGRARRRCATRCRKQGARRAAARWRAAAADIAKEVLDIARTPACRARAAQRHRAKTRPAFSIRCDEIVRERQGARRSVLLDLYHGEWNGDVSQVYKQSF